MIPPEFDIDLTFRTDNPALDALRVITRDRRIRAYLQEHDPRALAQCEAVLGEEHTLWLQGVACEGDPEPPMIDCDGEAEPDI